MLHSSVLVERESPWLNSLVGRAMRYLTLSDGSLAPSPGLVEDYMFWLARKALEAGLIEAKQTVLTSVEVAALLGVDRTTVFRRARERGLGWHIGRDWLFWPEDLEKLR